jgi:hypothetical protein
MAVNLPRGTWDPLTSNRAPIIGDISTQYDVGTDSYRTAVYDGQRWTEMNNGITTGSSGTITTSNITTTRNNGTSIADTPPLQEQMFDFMKQNLRVAEYTDGDGKIHTVQLEMRLGPSYVWEPIKRVKTKNPL